MLYRLRREFQVRRFNRAIAGVLQTAPLRLQDAPLTIVSMVGDDDVPMYLLAMKAFYRRIGRGRLVAIVARSMPEASRALLRHHLPGILLEPIEGIDTGPCQRGGCWERLLYILDRAAREYVIQLDSDTLPIAGDLDEIDACIRANRPFTMIDGDRSLQSLRSTSDAAKRMNTDYIGVVAERMFDRLPDCDERRYVRGSASLAGFPPGGTSRAEVETFHARMEELVGATRWREWGTEQCASNFAVANSPGATLLPHPAYTSFFPGGPRDGVKMFHFMGTFRFDDGVFVARARDEIAQLLAPECRTA